MQLVAGVHAEASQNTQPHKTLATTVTATAQKLITQKILGFVRSLNPGHISIRPPRPADGFHPQTWMDMMLLPVVGLLGVVYWLSKQRR